MGKIIIKELESLSFGKRLIRIYLPTNYNEAKEYPVIYMHDGQNLFDDSLSYSKVSWGVKETMEALEETKEINGAIVVGIDNSEKRVEEYMPWITDKMKASFPIFFTNESQGKANVYVDFLINTVIPYINTTYKTKNNFENTYIIGSSLGALISGYIVHKYPKIFSKIGLFSIPMWKDKDEYFNELSKLTYNKNHHFYVYVGGSEKVEESESSAEYADFSRQMANYLRTRFTNDVVFVCYENEVHNEIAWRKAFPDFVRWCLKK